MDLSVFREHVSRSQDCTFGLVRTEHFGIQHVKEEDGVGEGRDKEAENGRERWKEWEG